MVALVTGVKSAMRNRTRSQPMPAPITGVNAIRNSPPGDGAAPCYKADCFLAGASCACCLNQSNAQEYPDEICYSFVRTVNSIPEYPVGPCFWSTEDPPRYCCRKDSADGYKKYSNSVCFAYNASYDAGADLPIKNQEPQDQGRCGSCWAFASSEQLSARVLLTPGNTLASWGPVVSPEVPVAFYNLGGCRGGWPQRAGEAYKEKGLPTLQCAPYVSGSCSNSTDGCWHSPEGICYGDSSLPWQKWGTYNPGYITDVQVVEGVAAMMDDLIKRGPLTVDFAVYDNFFDYTSGVYLSASGEVVGGHAVLIVGYGDDESGTPYWRIRNSWGPSWGEKGHFRFLRGNNLCNIENNAVSFIMGPVAEADESIAASSSTRIEPWSPSQGQLMPGAWLRWADWQQSALVTDGMKATKSALSVKGFGGLVEVHAVQTQVVAGIHLQMDVTASSSNTSDSRARFLVHAHKKLYSASTTDEMTVAPKFEFDIIDVIESSIATSGADLSRFQHGQDALPVII